MWSFFDMRWLSICSTVIMVVEISVRGLGLVRGCNFGLVGGLGGRWLEGVLGAETLRDTAALRGTVLPEGTAGLRSTAALKGAAALRGTTILKVTAVLRGPNVLEGTALLRCQYVAWGTC